MFCLFFSSDKLVLFLEKDLFWDLLWGFILSWVRIVDGNVYCIYFIKLWCFLIVCVFVLGGFIINFLKKYGLFDEKIVISYIR